MSVAGVAVAGRARGARARPSADQIMWLAVLAAAAACLWLREDQPWLVTYPAELVVPVSAWINAFMEWFVGLFRPAFQVVAAGLKLPMEAIQTVLHWLPWPATAAVFAVLAHRASGWRLAGFTVVAMLYMVLVGYWDESMNTLALVFMSWPLALAIGFALGVLAFRWPRSEAAVKPALDVMQTMPTFAYLIPILLLFGFGPVVGLIASAIYACPPMVRNVVLGLRRVPREVVESGLMCGATARQLFWWVRVPTAMPTILIGVNQTLMAALSMVIIAAIIGSSADIGWEVLSTMRKARFGESLLAGVVIALMAMVLDRVSRGLAERRAVPHHQAPVSWRRHPHLLLALGAVVALTALAGVVGPLAAWPDAWVVYPAAPINHGLAWVTTEYADLTKAVKNSVLFFFLLPLRIGLETTVRPFSWGMELTPAFIWSYVALVVATAGLVTRWAGWRGALAVVLMASLYYFGVTRTPWPAFMGVVALLAWQVGGARICVFALLGMAFILVTGVWAEGMRSVYLCAAAVITSFLMGGALGVWASASDRVSTFLRPINDTLQTMPLFVFLIPVLMFFQVGEFTAFLAIVAYAVVPSIRYTEHGLRNVRSDIVEAARSMGCTRSQILFQVKLPLALPEIMLGLNQTIMFGLAMLVIAALVGTKGLGQLVYIALGKADTGKGLVAGISMALVAMITDRIIHSWSERRKSALGIV